MAKNPHATSLGKIGGKVKSEAKAAASRLNGAKSKGRPKGSKNKPKEANDVDKLSAL